MMIVAGVGLSKAQAGSSDLFTIGDVRRHAAMCGDAQAFYM
nr:hypothetical protein [uncultured Ralstonia sp.]